MDTTNKTKAKDSDFIWVTCTLRQDQKIRGIYQWMQAKCLEILSK